MAQTATGVAGKNTFVSSICIPVKIRIAFLYLSFFLKAPYYAKSISEWFPLNDVHPWPAYNPSC